MNSIKAYVIFFVAHFTQYEQITCTKVSHSSHFIGFVSFPYFFMSCSCIPKDPKCVPGFLLRISFGLSLLFVGIDHYANIADFSQFVSSGLGSLGQVGTLWAYVFPGLMIIGGALLVLGQYLDTAVWTAGLALAAIPAGLTLKPILSDTALTDVMPGVINAIIWLVLYYLVTKSIFCKK
jgi:hypothetical protein